jgi:NitT/TauT family transport system substrate-binding protein
MSSRMTTLRLAEPFRAIFYAPYYVAIARGEAAAQGIDLMLSTAGSPDVASAQLIDGSMDVAWSGPMRPLLERSRDPASPLRSFGAAVVRDPFLLVGRGTAPGFRLSDLAGLRVAVPSEVPTPVWCLLDDLRRAGVPADGLARRPMPEAAAALRAGEIDAALVFEPFAAELEEQDCTVWYAAATRGPTAYSALYATAARMARTPDLFAALRRALGGALAWLSTAPPEAIAETIAPWFPDLPRQRLDRAVARYAGLGLWPATPEMPAEAMDRLAVAMVGAGVMTTDPGRAVWVDSAVLLALLAE